LYLHIVKTLKDSGLDFKIDKLTNSIENVQTGDSFSTEVSLLSKEDLRIISPKNSWKFNWLSEFKYPTRDVYKLTIVNNPGVIQGAVSLESRIDHVYMHLLESAPFNVGRNKVYVGVPGNLVAFACKLSFQRGGEGYVSFLSKSNLIDRYVNSLGAIHCGGQLMVINTEAALKLTNKYFQ